VTRRLAVATACYLCWASGAAVVAIVRNMPAAFGGLSTGLSVTNDFLIGFGTALSPPLWWMLVQAFFAARAARNAEAMRPTIGALTAFGALECIGALGEPVTQQALAPATFDPLLAVTQLGMVLLPLAIVIFGVRAWRLARNRI
jgi:hypothetical protein